MSPTQVVTVYTRSADGQLHVAGHVSFDKLVFLSKRCDREVRRTSGKTVVFSQEEVNHHAVVHLCEWMAGYDPKKAPATQIMNADHIRSPLSAGKKATGSPEFLDVVKVYQAQYVFQIDVALKGHDIHEAIDQYIRQAPISADEFAIVFEWLPFAVSIKKTAVHGTAFQKVFGPIPPEIEKIEEWAKEFGVLEEMIGLEAHHRAHKQRQAENAQKHEEYLARQEANQKKQEALVARQEQRQKTGQ